MERLQTSNVSVSNGKIRCPIEKSISAVNLPLKIFRGATIVNADTGSLKSLHTLFDAYLYHKLGWNLNQIVFSEMYNLSFEFFWQKTEFFETIFDKAPMPLCKMFTLGWTFIIVFCLFPKSSIQFKIYIDNFWVVKSWKDWHFTA